MTLPLLSRTSDDSFCRYTPGKLDLVQIGVPARIPDRKPGPGEQYRFHFDMTKCIGCKCCEVACSEQNNNPGGIRWRRVGELEGGVYPAAKRFHLSMGCNHCLDAACLKGCPVDAYRKDDLTGLVLHNAEACIGCQYCTWNCPYGVPQFNEERGVVGKCDMCHGRLEEGREPACVAVCPQGAIEIEIVNIAEWRESKAVTGNAPGLPSAEETMSTTRITQPESIEETLRKADYHRVRPEQPHWPLVFLLVLTQMSVGTLAALAAAGAGLAWAGLALAAFAGHAALGCSLLHLGRPIHAIRALKMWRRSWLSREVLCFSLFAGATALLVPAAYFGHGAAPVLMGASLLSGVAGIVSSAFIYKVPARPAWNSWRTPIEFALSAAILGPLAAAACGIEGMRPAAAIAGAAIAASGIWKYVSMARSSEFELKQSARLLRRTLCRAAAWRFALLALACAAAVPAPAALPLALASEILGRYLFFVSVVPRNMAATFFSGREAA